MPGMYRFDPQSAIYPVNPERTDLAEEFRDNISGPHSEELKKILFRMRGGPMIGKWVLYRLGAKPEWVLGQLPVRRDAQVTLHEDLVFTDRDAAEWQWFKNRWRELTSTELDV